MRVTGVPALHGPRLLKRHIGDVTGFVLEWEGQRHGALYVSGDTILFGDLAEIGRRFEIGTAIAISAAVASTTSPGLSGSA